MKKTNFSLNSTPFAVSALTVFFTILALIGIEMPDPAQLASDTINTLSTGGFYAVVALIVTNIAGPVWNWARRKQFPKWPEIFGSPSLWISISNLFVAWLVMRGIDIPEGTPESVVGAIYMKDLAGLVTILASNLLNPLIRWIRDKRTLAVE